MDMKKRRRLIAVVCYQNYLENGEFELPHGSKKELAEDLDCHRNTIRNDVECLRGKLTQIKTP